MKLLYSIAFQCCFTKFDVRVSFAVGVVLNMLYPGLILDFQFGKSENVNSDFTGTSVTYYTCTSSIKT